MRRVKLSNPFKSRIIDEELIREHLALERTKLANERTLLSYIRASLYLLIGGIALIQVKEYPNLLWVGYVALFICVLFILVGISRYVVLDRKLNKLLEPDNEDDDDKPIKKKL
jgi:putative membrane protein